LQPAQHALQPRVVLTLRTRAWARVPYRAAPIQQEQRADPLHFAQFAAFPVWLLAQEHREHAVGEVARAAAADPDLLGQTMRGKRPQAPELRQAWDIWRHWRRNQFGRRPPRTGIAK
jgi:hypothetical protein